MTEILQSPHHQISCSESSYDDNDGGILLQQTIHSPSSSSNNTTLNRRKRQQQEVEEQEQQQQQVSLLAFVVTVFRKSIVGSCSNSVVRFEGFNCDTSNLKRNSSSHSKMEIGVPTDVRHVAHVTFDRFNGFLGLPVEFEPDVPSRPPSASTSVFGVSTESMQLSFDSRGNSVPTILLMMQRRLYAQGGLQAEGIFRINGDNGQEEQIREQLNRGEVPENIDVHSLAGLIKAWFRELPNGVLDSIEPEQVMQAQSEEECARLVRLLPPTEASLMNWAVNLMADVAQLENLNKMNARNIAMVFAPNMTQMADPLTALMYAVQVMNFLKTLIVKTLREREDVIIEEVPASRFDHFDENNGPHHSLQGTVDETNDVDEEDQDFSVYEPALENHENTSQDEFVESQSQSQSQVQNTLFDEASGVGVAEGCSRVVEAPRSRNSQTSNMNHKKSIRKNIDKSKGSTIVSRLNSRTERIEAWR